MPCSTGVLLQKYLASDIRIDQMREGIVAQLADAMTWLHASKVARLDMKLGNLLWEAQACKLVVVDFGMSLQLSEDGTLWDDITPFIAVTVNYRPPERWHTPVIDGTKCYPVVVWSSGVTAIEIVSRKVLFTGVSKQTLYAQVERLMQLWKSRKGHAAMVAIRSQLRTVSWCRCAPEPAVRPAMNRNIKDGALRLPPCPMYCWPQDIAGFLA